MLHTHIERYRAATGVDALSFKSGVFAHLQLPSGRQLQVLGTHLQSMDPETAQQVRRQQYAQLQERVLTPFAKPCVPQIVAGDLNTDINHPDGRYGQMLEVLGFFRNPAQGLPNALPNQCTWCGHLNSWANRSDPSSAETLDYILYRNPHSLPDALRPIAYSVAQPKHTLPDGTQQDLSDHQPVFVQFVFQ
jgi:endonuclease/exonuclease/phosphatase family metal-dependent hydrolase